MSIVTHITATSLVFDDGATVASHHESDCCEMHWLSFADLSLDDFNGLDFDLSGDSWFERVPGYGIRLLPLRGHPVAIPGYCENNGYYSENLAIVISCPGVLSRVFDITECQRPDVRE